MKTRTREREEKRKTVTDFRKVTCSIRKPFSKRLRAALLRSFRGQHGEKLIYARGVPEVTGTLGKAISHFKSKRSRGPHHHVETMLISAAHKVRDGIRQL